MLNNPLLLVCSDLSEKSDHVLVFAENLRRATQGKIHLVHVWEYPLQWDWIEHDIKQVYLNDILRQKIRNELEQKLREQIKRCGADSTFEILDGEIETCIIQSLGEQKASIMMIGPKGKRTNPFHLGGHAAKLVASSPIPVFVIKNDHKPERIAALVDTNNAMKEIIHFGEELSFLFSSKFDVISLWRETFTQFFNLTSLDKNNKLLRLTEEEKHDVLSKIESKIKSELDPHSKASIKVALTMERQVAYHLLDILSKDKTDLIVMGKHHKGRLERLLIGSETRRMLELFAGNLLILPSVD